MVIIVPFNSLQIFLIAALKYPSATCNLWACSEPVPVDYSSPEYGSHFPASLGILEYLGLRIVASAAV